MSKTSKIVKQTIKIALYYIEFIICDVEDVGDEYKCVRITM